MPVSNKTHRKLQERLDRTEAEHLKNMTAKNAQIERLEAERDRWRAQAEALTSSPEIKADTEAAFKRGMEHARNQLKNFLMKHFMTEESQPVSEIPTYIKISKPKITIETDQEL